VIRNSFAAVCQNASMNPIAPTELGFLPIPYGKEKCQSMGLSFYHLLHPSDVRFLTMNFALLCEVRVSSALR
jgi:hypothetical protein